MKLAEEKHVCELQDDFEPNDDAFIKLPVVLRDPPCAKNIKALCQNDPYYIKAKNWVLSHMKKNQLDCSYATIMKPSFSKKVS